MKRLLLFLALFGGGLGLLLFFSAQQRKKQEERVPDDGAQETEVDLPFTRIPDDVGQEGAAEGEGGGGIAATLSGWASFDVFEESERGHKLYDLAFDEVIPLGGDLYDLVGITAHTFDPEDEGLESTLVAERGRAKIEWRGALPSVGRERPVELFDAVVVLHRGTPMAPLTLTLASVTGDLERDIYTSEERVLVEGVGVRAEGVGLEADQRNQTLELRREGHVVMDLDEQRVMELRATGEGPLTLARAQVQGETESLEVTVTDGARALMRGEEAFHVDAEELTLRGDSRRHQDEGGERRTFVPTGALALGDVVARHGLGETRGQRIVVEFDSNGDLEHFESHGDPSIAGEVEAATERDGEPLPQWVELAGVGPLVVIAREEGRGASFEMPGPATVIARDSELDLTASDGVEGLVRSDGSGEALLRGEVQGGVYGVGLRGADVDLEASPSEGALRVLVAHSERPAHLEGEDDEGRPFVLDTQESLTARFVGAEVSVPLARVARLELRDSGSGPVIVEAGEVRDLDPLRGSFDADGGVRATGNLGVTTAERAVGHSRSHLELFGRPASAVAPPEPVRMDDAPGAVQGVESAFLSAMHVDLRETFAKADGDVELRLRREGATYELDGAEVELWLEGAPQEGVRTPFRLEARDVRRGLVRDATGSTLVTARFVTAEGELWRDEEGNLEADLHELVGFGGVTATFTGERVLTAVGERFVWTPAEGGHLEAAPGERVEARGSLRPGGPRYLLTATWLEERAGGLEALEPILREDASGGGSRLQGRLGLRRADARWMALDEFGLLLSGDAHFEGVTEAGVPLELDAGDLHLEQIPEASARTENLEGLVAWNGFELHLGDELVGTGELLEASYDSLRMEGQPARVEMRGFVLESYEVVYDVPRVLITTGQGRFLGAPGTAWEGWVTTYESMQPFERGDSTVMALRQPVMTKGDEELRANWALLWVDRDEWIGRTADWLGRARGHRAAPAPPQPSEQQPAEEPADVGAPTLFGRVNSKQLSEVLKELYLEGGVEYLVGGDRVARLGSAYFDMVDGHGWFRDSELWIKTSVRGVLTRIAVRADWLRHSADGTLSADEAQITDCEFAEPDYFVRTQNLRMKPTSEEGSTWDILLKDNSLVFDNGVSMPLPRVHYKSDGKGLPTLGSFRFGNAARFGTFIQATMNIDVGESVTDAVAKAADLEPADVDGDWRLKASYYKLRGLQLGTGFRLRGADKFWMNVYVDGVIDTGRDKGIVRSKTNNTENFRWVIHSRSRYLRSDKEWFDLQFATQSDAGVQSEFYEGEFIRFDKRNTFLRWRKADDATYLSANVRVRANSFRNDVERLPDLSAVRGRLPFADIAGVPLLYTGSVDAAYLRRKEGNSAVFSPFDPVFDDGLGDREHARADTRQRVEAPFDLGAGGVRVKPYTSFAATAWSQGVDADSTPSRGALIVGAEAQSTYFRTWKYGVIHSLTPTFGARSDVATFAEDGTPVEIDRIDAPLEGKFVDLGLRSRWRVPGSLRRLDVAAKISHGTDVAPGLREGWQPASVLAEFYAAIGDVPFGVRHDARYDLDDGDTTLSYTGASILPWPTLGLEWAYHHALDDQRDLLYDAMTLGARWEASDKWQIEGRQTVSRIDNANLNSVLRLRRIGHDFIFEIEYGFRAGEGSSSVSFNIRPELGWRRPGFGLIDTLKTLRL